MDLLGGAGFSDNRGGDAELEGIKPLQEPERAKAGGKLVSYRSTGCKFNKDVSTQIFLR